MQSSQPSRLPPLPRMPDAACMRRLRLAYRAAFRGESVRARCRYHRSEGAMRLWRMAVAAAFRPLTPACLSTLVDLASRDELVPGVPAQDGELRSAACFAARLRAIPENGWAGLRGSRYFELGGRARSGGPAVQRALTARGLIAEQRVRREYGWITTSRTALTPEARSLLEAEILPVLCVMRFFAIVGALVDERRVFGPGGMFGDGVGQRGSRHFT
jgi:hypothetical protein